METTHKKYSYLHYIIVRILNKIENKRHTLKRKLQLLRCHSCHVTRCLLAVDVFGVFRFIGTMDHLQFMIIMAQNQQCCSTSYTMGHPIECVRTCDQESYLFIETKESICIKKEFNSHRINLLLQCGGLFFVHSSNMADMTSCEHTLYKEKSKA